MYGGYSFQVGYEFLMKYWMNEWLNQSIHQRLKFIITKRLGGRPQTDRRESSWSLTFLLVNLFAISNDIFKGLWSLCIGNPMEAWDRLENRSDTLTSCLTSLLGAFVVAGDNLKKNLQRSWVCVELCSCLSYLLPPNAAEWASLSVAVVSSPLFERIQAGVMFCFQTKSSVISLSVSEPFSNTSRWGFLEVNSRGSGQFLKVVLIEEHAETKTYSEPRGSDRLNNFFFTGRGGNSMWTLCFGLPVLWSIQSKNSN